MNTAPGVAAPDWTAGAFDSVAARYDGTFGPQANLVMAELRRRSLAALMATFPPNSRLLEIGCGTGDEAIALARAGRQVLATDPSSAMLAQARAKCARTGLGEMIEFRPMSAAQIVALRSERGPSAFDGAYASFGPLNCEPDLAPVGRELQALLRPNAALVCSVMNRFCLWESIWFALHADFRRTARRWRPGPHYVDLVPGQPTSQFVRYYTPGTFAARLQPWFAVESVVALPLLLPPPYLDPLYRRHRRIFNRLAGLDRRLATFPPLHGLGDHFLMVLRQTGRRAA